MIDMLMNITHLDYHQDKRRWYPFNIKCTHVVKIQASIHSPIISNRPITAKGLWRIKHVITTRARIIQGCCRINCNLNE